MKRRSGAHVAAALCGRCWWSSSDRGVSLKEITWREEKARACPGQVRHLPVQNSLGSRENAAERLGILRDADMLEGTMTDADIIYYRWLDWPVFVLLALLAASALFVLIRDLQLSAGSIRASGLSTDTRTGFRLSLIAIPCALCAYIYYSITGYSYESKRLVISSSYLACVSWREPGGKFMQIPWSSFTNISRVYWGRYPNPHLRFDLDPARAKDFPWTEYVRNQGWVLCDIHSLTDNPRENAFSTDTDEILSRVLNTWRAAQIQ